MTPSRTTAPLRTSLIAGLPPGRFEDLLVRADRAALAQSVARGLTHALANALQVIGYDNGAALARAPGDLGLTAARRVLLGLARPGESIVGPVPLGDVLAEVDDWQRCQTGLAPVPVEMTVAPGLPAARVCATHVRHALLDLVTNAKEAVAGRRDASIRVAARAEGGGLVVTVEDDGPGVPADRRERVFEPFFTTKGEGLHLGLGLTAAQHLLVADGGSLECAARGDGPGACFVARLPAWPEDGGAR